MKPILVGAVIYDPKVTLIWDIIKEFFAAEGCAIDSVFYSNYELQVDALVDRHIDIAWNSPLAWLDAQRRTGGSCRALAMRDTDRDRVTHLVVRADSGIRTVGDLQGRTIATGAADSPQATLLPLHHLHQHGVVVRVRRHDLLVGKHGDHIGGEKEALRSLHAGDADATAMLDLNWDAWCADGTIDPAQLRILDSTAPYDHCNFTALGTWPADRADQWSAVLFRMRYDNPEHRTMMDLEGLKAWLPGRTSGYTALAEAVREQSFFEPAVR
jgi:ABC-type phosphate/phosphonate transport system substrate-binding protein